MSRILALAVPSAALLLAAVSIDAIGGPPQRTSQTGSAEAPLQGRLEMVWGDAKPGSRAPHILEVNLVDDAGRRTPLDTAAAARAAGDLYGLYGRRVAVSFGPQKRAGTLPSRAQPDAIVAIDGLPSSLRDGRAGLTSTGGISARAVTGTTAWATLMCKFKDIATEQKARSFFQGQYGSSPGQLDHYWRTVSYNKINLTGSTAYGWFTLPQNRAYYVTTGVDGKPKVDLGKLFTDCTNAANASVNFAANGGLQGINMMFNGELDGNAWGGSHCATLDGINKCWSTTWNPPWSFNNLAPLSHEMGHAYGLPHANNSDGDSDTYDNPWDVMSGAFINAASDATYGLLPKHISIYSRDRLGWLDAGRKVKYTHSLASNTYTLDRASLLGSVGAQMLILEVRGSTTRYYTIEVRKRTGTYEANLAGDAVIIHSVDTTRTQPAWSVDATRPAADISNNEGSMFKVGEAWTSPDPLGSRFRVEVVSATTEGFRVKVSGL